MAEPRLKGLRILLGMLGLDVHSKGIRTLAGLLRDAGVEVVYVGEHNSAEGLARIATSEDVDTIGISFSTTTYLEHTRSLMVELDRAGLSGVPVLVGGLIHPDDEADLRSAGVAGVFGPATGIEDVLSFLDTVWRDQMGASQ